MSAGLSPWPTSCGSIDHPPTAPPRSASPASTARATVGRAAAFAIFLTVSAVGLGAMLLASEAAFTAVKWVGAAYLFWLGWKAWHSREFSGLALVEGEGALAVDAPFSLRALIAQELLLGITNPKAIILFAAIFPQFIDPGQPAARQFVVLGSIYLASEFVSTAAYARGGRQIRRFIRTSRGVVRCDSMDSLWPITCSGW